MRGLLPDRRIPVPGEPNRECDRLLGLCLLLGPDVERQWRGEYLGPEEAAGALGTTPYRLRCEERKGTIPLTRPPRSAGDPDTKDGRRYPAGSVYLMKVSAAFADATDVPDEPTPERRLPGSSRKTDPAKALKLEGSSIADLLTRYGGYVCRDREREAVRLRYGLRDRRMRTYSEIASEMGVSRSRVSQLLLGARRRLLAEHKIMEKFRRWMGVQRATTADDGWPRTKAGGYGSSKDGYEGR